MTAAHPPLTIPQTDPRAAYLAQRTEIDAAISRVLDGGSYILGREVEAFERRFAEYIGVAHAIGVASGTDAIELALRAAASGSGILSLPCLIPQWPQSPRSSGPGRPRC